MREVPSLPKPPGRRPLVGALGLALAAAHVACGAAEPPASPTPAWSAQYERWRHPEPLPNFRLIDQDTQPFRLGALGDGYVLMGFIFTHCQVAQACPLTTARMVEVQRLWATLPAEARAPAGRLHLLSLTLDPTRDTPAALKGYAQRWGADLSSWTFATGPHRLMEEALPSLFNVVALPEPGGAIDHTVKVALLEPGLVLLETWKDDTFSPRAVVDRILTDAAAAPGGSAR